MPKYTPPTEFPKVYANGCTVLGLGHDGMLVGFSPDYVCNAWHKHSGENVNPCQYDDLVDIPERVVRYVNAYPNGIGTIYKSQAMSEIKAKGNTCVARFKISYDVDGSNPTIEPVDD